MKIPSTLSLGSLLAVAWLVSACEPVPEDQPDDGDAFSPEPELVEPEPSLVERLANESFSASGFGSWRCESTLADVPVVYVFPRVNPNEGQYAVLHPVSGFEAGFEVQGEASHSLELRYDDSGVQESISNIVFEGIDHWSAFSTTDGSLSCERFQVSLPGV